MDYIIDALEEQDGEIEEPFLAVRGHNFEWILSAIFETGISA
jgi:hypothetical protein